MRNRTEKRVQGGMGYIIAPSPDVMPSTRLASLRLCCTASQLDRQNAGALHLPQPFVGANQSWGPTLLGIQPQPQSCAPSEVRPSELPA